jgi:hypothetical protein
MQSKLWERLTAWIQKHYEDKIVLLGDLNSILEALATHEIVWKDIGRRRPRGRVKYSNAALRTLLLPAGLRWKVAQRRPTRHDPIPLHPTLVRALTLRYGQLHDCLDVVFTAVDWRQAHTPALQFEDCLSMGNWLLLQPDRQTHTFNSDDWSNLSPKLGLRWEIAAVKPAQGLLNEYTSRRRSEA